MNLLAMLQQSLLSLPEFVASGGPVVLAIVGTGLLMWTLIAERFYWYGWVYPAALARARSAWLARPERHSWTARRIRAAAIGELDVAMHSTLPLLRACIPIAPLLGLLGTVGGMLEVFDVMSLRGQSDAKAMADGISHAMVATLTGLGVSISGMYFAHHYRQRAEREREVLATAFALDDVIAPRLARQRGRG